MNKIYDFNQNTQTDEFGVCHKDFSLRDEIEYNFQRAKEREKQQCLNPQNMQVSQTTNLQGIPKANWNDIITAGITGLGEGMTAGIERFINGASSGNYGKIMDANFDNAYTKRQNNMQNYANAIGLENANRLANTAIDISGKLFPYAYGASKFIK